MAHVRLHENSSTASSGTTADSTNRHPETRLIGFSPTWNSPLTISFRDSSSKPPPAAHSTPHTQTYPNASVESVSTSSSSSVEYDGFCRYGQRISCVSSGTGRRPPSAVENYCGSYRPQEQARWTDSGNVAQQRRCSFRSDRLRNSWGRESLDDSAFN